LPPPPFFWSTYVFPLFLLLDTLSLFALLLLCYFLYRALLASRIRLFAFFFAGFAILAAGEVARIVVLLTAVLSGTVGLRALFLSHIAGAVARVSETVALLFIAAGYTFEAGERARAAALPLLQRRRDWADVFWLTSLLNVMLLTYIVINAVGVYMSSRKRTTALPAVAFFCMLLSDILLMQSLLWVDELFFITSKALYFLGLMALLMLAIEVSRA